MSFYIAARLDFYPVSNSDDIVLTHWFKREDWNDYGILDTKVANEIVNAFNNKYHSELVEFNNDFQVSIDDLTSTLIEDLERIRSVNNIDRKSGNGSISVLYCTGFETFDNFERWSTQSYNMILKNLEGKNEEIQKEYVIESEY